MDVEIYKIIDEIMEIFHQITSFIVDIAKVEEEGRKITQDQVLNNKILNMLFERLQEKYRKIEDIILDIVEKNKLTNENPYSRTSNYN